MSTHQIHIFISHAWKHSGHYDTLADWIFNNNWSVGQASLNFFDYSIPKDDPIHNAPSNRALKDAIFRKISCSHVIVIPTGMYASYSAWIQKEIDGANSYSKPILAVNPKGQQRPSSVVIDSAADTCGWMKESVISKIWQLYRNN